MSTKKLLQSLSEQVHGHALTLDDLDGVPGWPSLLEAIAVSSLAVEEVHVDAKAGTVRGTAAVLGLSDASVTCTFADADGGISATVAADFDEAVGIDVPGGKTFGLEGAGFSIHVPGSGGALVGDIHATLKAGALEVPVSVQLPAAASGWIIRGNIAGVSLEGLDALASLVAHDDLAQTLPVPLGDVAKSLVLSGVEIRCAAKSIDRISATVTSEADWTILPNHVVLKDPSISLSLIAPGDDALQDIAVMVSGVVQADGTVIPISVVRDQGAVWRCEIPSTHIPLPGPAALLGLVADGKLLAVPEGLAGSGGIALTDFALVFDGGAGKVRSVRVGFSANESWQLPLVESLSVSDASLVVEADYADGAGIGATVSGTVEVGGVKLALTGTKSAEQSDWELLEGSLEETVIPLGSVMQQFLPAAAAPDLEIHKLTVKLEPATHKYSVSGDVRGGGGGPWKIPVGVAELSVDGITFDVGVARTNGQAKTTGFLHGEASFAGATFILDYPLQGDLRIQTTIPSLQLSNLLRTVGIPSPAFLPDVDFEDVAIDVTPATGVFSVSARLAKLLTIPIGGGALTVDTFEVLVARKAAAEGAAKTAAGIDCELTLGIGPFGIADQVQLEAFTLTFSSESGGAWTAAGDLSGKVLDTGIDLSASYAEDDSKSVLELRSGMTSTTDLLSLGALGALSVDSFSLQVETPRSADDKGVGPARSWIVAAQGDVRLGFAGAGLDSKGRLEFATENGSTSLAFVPEKARATVPLDPLHPERPHAAMQLDFRRVGASHTPDAGWGFDAAVDLSFRGLPAGLQAYLPEDEPIKTTFRAGGKLVTLTADPVMKPVLFTIPAITRGGVDIDLGKATIFARNLRVSLGSAVSLGADLNVGLPSRLNYVFGAKTDGTGPAVTVFRTYDPAQPGDNLFQTHLDVGTDGIGFKLLSSPFSFLTVDKGRADLDLDAFGALNFDLPTLQFDPATQTFSADVAVNVERLAVPLTPVISLLEAFKLDGLARVFPKSLPFQPIELMDREGNLRTKALIDFLESAGGVKLPKEFKTLLDDIASVVDRLPDGLKRYFRIALPGDFHLKVTTTATGSVRLDFGVGEKSEPLRFLFPSVEGPFPELVGIELYSVAFGEAFGGALLIVEVDARIDRFNLPTIVGSLALPKDGAPVIPASSSTLQNRLILDKLFMIVFYQAGIPIPIPLFYDELGMEYWGIEGLQCQGHIKLPMPRFNLTEAIQQIGVFKEFFTDEGYYLDEKATPKDMNLVFSTGLNYIELPQYLGAGMLGDKKPGPEINAYQKIAQLLNVLKRIVAHAAKLSVNDVIHLIPLDHRVAAGEVGASGISANGAYALTTPKEFAEVAYKRLDVEGARVKDALSILPSAATAAKDEQGICLFFRGGFDVSKVVEFEAMYALAAAGSRFGTGFAVHGAVAGGTVDAALSGQFTIDPSQPVPVGLEGHVHLTVSAQPILTGDVSLGNRGFRMHGMMDVFPGNSKVQLTGHVTGDIDKNDFKLAGDVAFVVGQRFTLVGGSLLLDTTRFAVTGTCFDQSLTFAIEKFQRTVGQATVEGLRFSAELHPVVIGDVFRLTGKGPHGGPHAAIEVSFGPAFGFELSGGVHLLGITASTTVRLTEQGYEFTASGSLLGVFACTVDVAAGSLTDGNQFRLTVIFSSGAITDIGKEALGLLTTAAADATKALNQARAGVKSAQDDLDGAIGKAQRQVNQASAAVRGIQRQINRKAAQIKKLKKGWGKFKNAAKIAQLGLEITGLEAELRTAQAGLAVAKAVLSFARSGTKIVGFVLTGALKEIADQANRARKALNAANKELARVERQLGKAAQLAGYKGSPLAIGGIGFTTAVNRVKGVKVSLVCNVTFLGAPQKVTVQSQLTSPATVAGALVGTLLGR